MTRAHERQHTANVYWDKDSSESAIYARGVWADGGVDVDLAAQWIDGNVPPNGPGGYTTGTHPSRKRSISVNIVLR